MVFKVKSLSHGLFVHGFLATSCLLSGFFSVATQADSLSQQRAMYEQAKKLVDQGRLDDYRALRPRISNYLLTPYVDYRAFSKDIGNRSPKQVEAFAKQYQDYPFSKTVGKVYLDALAKRQAWQDYLRFQTKTPEGQRYQCQFYYAKYMTGQRKEAFAGARSLWNDGRNVSSACDPLFNRWKSSGDRTDQDISNRLKMAFDARNTSLVNFLSKEYKTPQAKRVGSQVAAMYASPARVSTFSQIRPITKDTQDFSVLGHQLLSRRNTQQAVSVLASVAKNQNLSADQKQEMADEAASWLTNTESPSLAKWRDQVLSQSHNLPYLERRARLDIQNGNLKGVGTWIAQMPEEGQKDLRWQYWLGRVEQVEGKNSAAQKRWESILGERNFYSAAAAVALGKEVEIPDKKVTYNAKLLAPHQKALARIQEMFATNKDGSARGEWIYLVNQNDRAVQEQLALYAQQKQWYNLAITATIEGDMWDYISLRFPIAYKSQFERNGQKHGVSPITMMALARQESALNPEAASPVGARGLMQIMPATAQHTASKYHIPYAGSYQLLDVNKNIEIGSQYLAEQLDQYMDNRIYAFAAYNAGPSRVTTWRGRTKGRVDAFSFIEAIPFNETRGYVQNILMFEAYYRQLLGQKGSFLTVSETNRKY